MAALGEPGLFGKRSLMCWPTMRRPAVPLPFELGPRLAMCVGYSYLSPYPSAACLRTEDTVHAALLPTRVTVPCGPNDGPDPAGMPCDSCER